MSLVEDQRKAIVEAALLGADRRLAAESAGVEEGLVYRWLNLGVKEPDSEEGQFRLAFLDAEAAGKAHRERVTKMRAIVEGSDAAWKILLARQEHFKQARAQAARGAQLSLLDT